MIHVSTGTASVRVTTNTGRRLSSASAHQTSPCIGATLTKIPRQSSVPKTHPPTPPPRRFAVALDIRGRFAPRSHRDGSGRQAVRDQAAPPPNDSQRLQPLPADRLQPQGHPPPGSPVEPCNQHNQQQCVSQCITEALARGKREDGGRVAVGDYSVADWSGWETGTTRRPGILSKSSGLTVCTGRSFARARRSRPVGYRSISSVSRRPTGSPQRRRSRRSSRAGFFAHETHGSAEMPKGSSAVRRPRCNLRGYRSTQCGQAQSRAQPAGCVGRDCGLARVNRSRRHRACGS